MKKLSGYSPDMKDLRNRIIEESIQGGRLPVLDGCKLTHNKRLGKIVISKFDTLNAKFDTLNAIKRSKLRGNNWIAIVLVKDWWPSRRNPSLIMETDFVVCKWSDFHDGEKSHIENMTTIAICRERSDAELLYKFHLAKS